MGDSDDELLDRWAAGDRAAGNELFRRHFDSVNRFFANKIERADAADLVQETFLSCVRSRDSFRRTSSFRTYLFAIARNALFAYWRRRGARGDALDVDEISVASLSTSAGSRLARNEDHLRLLAAMRELPIDQQVLLELHYWEELERDQLAEVFDVEPATTRSRLFRARQALKARLGTLAEGEPGAADDARLDDLAYSAGASAPRSPER